MSVMGNKGWRIRQGLASRHCARYRSGGMHAAKRAQAFDRALLTNRVEQHLAAIEGPIHARSVYKYVYVYVYVYVSEDNSLS